MLRQTRTGLLRGQPILQLESLRTPTAVPIESRQGPTRVRGGRHLSASCARSLALALLIFCLIFDVVS